MQMCLESNPKQAKEIKGETMSGRVIVITSGKGGVGKQLPMLTLVLPWPVPEKKSL